MYELVKDNGGHAISVYDKKEQLANKLLADGRVNYIATTDYTEGSDIDIYVKNVLNKINKRTENE